MTDAGSEPDAVDVPVSTSFLPDHLVNGDPTGIESNQAADEQESGDEESAESDATDEFCQSWQQHLTGSSTPF